MKKTYATSMPNHIGAFLKASKCFAALGINITRVSYDKSVDSHMLFLDVEGTQEQIRMADIELEKIGYLQDRASNSSVVLIDYRNNLAFTGDIYINIHGLTSEQAKYNQYAPILMTSVDTDPKLCAAERTAILRRLGVGNWKIFGAHGAPKDYCVK